MTMVAVPRGMETLLLCYGIPYPLGLYCSQRIDTHSIVINGRSGIRSISKLRVREVQIL